MTNEEIKTKANVAWTRILIDADTLPSREVKFHFLHMIYQQMQNKLQVLQEGVKMPYAELVVEEEIEPVEVIEEQKE